MRAHFTFGDAFIHYAQPAAFRAFEEQNGFPLEPNLIVLGLMGSHSHVTYLPPEEANAVDDVDLMRFVVPPVEYHLGLPRWEHWPFQFEELEVVLYGLEKAVRLLRNSHQNIVGLLWLRDAEYVHRHHSFQQLRTQCSIFSSQAAAEAFAGYAADQLKRMFSPASERFIVSTSADTWERSAKPWSVSINML